MISLANPAASRLFQRQLTQHHILDVIDPSHRSPLLDKIVKAREEDNNILVCGDPVPIIKANQCKSSAILWLKERKKGGSSTFIWIFEEVSQSTVKMMIHKQHNTIHYVEVGIVDLFDQPASQLMNQSIYTILPQFDPSHTLFTGYSQSGARFPVIVYNEDKNDYLLLRITSLPTLAGLITVGQDGYVNECEDSMFTKYLFGYPNIKGMHVSTLIPQFSTLVSCLEKDELLQHGCILNSTICRDVLSTRKESIHVAVNRKPSTTPAGRPLPILVAIHRDGTYLEIDLQLQLTHNMYSLWITFDRQATLSRYGHTFQYTNTTTAPSATQGNNRSKSVNIPTTSIKKENTHQLHTSSINHPWTKPVGEYSAQTLKTNIHDYEIMGELGQGTYGIVKLAYLKKDPEKKKVVIKYVYKSRVLVDCWTRDKKLGLVPAEIHVLHTLRKIPHANCSDMLDYFEDDDHYYVVMDLFGAGMDLFDYIELRKDGISESEIRVIFRQIIEAVSHLHDNHIIHRDIKDENVILDLKGGVRLIDFGSATYMKEGKRYDTFVGTLDYAAPEVLKGQTYTGPPQDIWACGTLLYTLIYRENPFYNIEEIMERELRIPFILSQESLDLIKKMLERDVEKRLTVHQVLAHPWLQLK
ncbi:hypothetical protein RMATCC62417_08681 [Rhizopus microsporus]|nr:hypothetical protein RMATCC62417_08681 [Rhizopus microsporus]